MNRFFHIVYLIIKPIVAILFPHRVVGLENLPEGGALLCANHASGWDPVLIAVCLPNDSGCPLWERIPFSASLFWAG